jgi:acetate kinase
MIILVLNCGSSSIKYKGFDMPACSEPLFYGIAERIGFDDSTIFYEEKGTDAQKLVKPLEDHNQALKETCGLITESVKNIGNGTIDAIGHRVVHGGANFSNPVLVDQSVKKAIKNNSKYAPLHNPLNLAGIEICERLFPKVPNIAVFDTALHQTIPAKAYLYGLPIELYEKHNIRKYGFQGISHGYVAKEAAKLINKPLESLKIITCHLGNGSSITAFKNGKSADTSMGLTPLEGLVMATRCGDIDPSIIFYLIESTGMSSAEVNDILNKNSGLKGLCGKSDMRNIIEQAKKGNKKAQTAIEIFVYRIQKYIGAYIAALNGIDAIVFTAGIGENSPLIRKRILANFQYLGLKIDEARNEENQAVFSTDDSTIYAVTIPTNEELVIAQQTYQIAADTF